MSVTSLNLSPMVKRRVGVALAVFASAFLTAYLTAKGGIGIDTISGAVSAGIAAVAHWAVNQLAPVVEKTDTPAPVRPANVPSPGNPPLPGA